MGFVVNGGGSDTYKVKIQTSDNPDFLSSKVDDITLEADLSNNYLKIKNVGTNEIADGSITTSKITNNSIITSKIADGSITEDKLSSDVDNLLNEGWKEIYSYNLSSPSVSIVVDNIEDFATEGYEFQIHFEVSYGTATGGQAFMRLVSNGSEISSNTYRYTGTYATHNGSSASSGGWGSNPGDHFVVSGSFYANQYHRHRFQTVINKPWGAYGITLDGFFSQYGSQSATTIYYDYRIGGICTDTSTITGIKFYNTSGNFGTGTRVRIWKRKK